MPENDGNLMKSASAAKRRTISRTSHWLHRETIAAFSRKGLAKRARKMAREQVYNFAREFRPSTRSSPGHKRA
jgi:hypothetical protein